MVNVDNVGMNKLLLFGYGNRTIKTGHFKPVKSGLLKLLLTSGNVVKKIAYDSFGNIITDTAPAFEVPFGFAGGLHDRDTGLVRFGYRDFDPDVGRWTAKDPIGFAGGDTDLYGYCLSDPVNAFDPYGLFWAEFGKGFSHHMATKAWETGKTPSLDALAAGLLEALKSLDPNYDKNFKPWQPWPVEFFLEPYLEKERLKDTGDFPAIPCA
jgi:RHS repeat-associated protein